MEKKFIEGLGSAFRVVTLQAEISYRYPIEKRVSEYYLANPLEFGGPWGT